MSRTLRVVLLALAAALIAAAPSSAAAPAYDDDTVIVKFRSGSSAADLGALGDRLGAKVGDVRRLGALVLRTSGDPAAVAARLERSSAVAYAEPNLILRTQAIPNDPLFGELYGLNNTGQTGGTTDADIDAPEGWDAAGLGT